MPKVRKTGVRIRQRKPVEGRSSCPCPQIITARGETKILCLGCTGTDLPPVKVVLKPGGGWICEEQIKRGPRKGQVCDTFNDLARVECRGCGSPAPEWVRGRGGRKASAPQGWICEGVERDGSCGAINDASRRDCHECGTPAPTWVREALEEEQYR